MAGILKLGSIPPLSVWHGEEITFKVGTKLGPGATFSKRATPRPAGEMKLDAKTGAFSYKPSPADREEITVWVRAHKGADEEKQKVVITPHPRLNPNFRVIRHLADLPDPADQTYVTVAESDAGRAVFNNTADYEDKDVEKVKVETKNVFVTGVRVVLESNSTTHPLFTLLDDKTNLRQVTICADEVIIRSPLRLPGTDLFVYARRLAFEGEDGGSINTMPRTVNVRSDKRDEGLKGQKAGDVRLYAQNVEAPGPTVHIKANGGKGQPARLGIAGAKGDSLDEWDGKGTTTTWWAGTETLDWKPDFGNLQGYTPVYAQVWEYYAPGWKGPWYYKFDCGSNKWPSDGKPPAKLPGRPGQGGDGGAIEAANGEWIKGRAEQKPGEEVRHGGRGAEQAQGRLHGGVARRPTDRG